MIFIYRVLQLAIFTDNFGLFFRFGIVKLEKEQLKSTVLLGQKNHCSLLSSKISIHHGHIYVYVYIVAKHKPTKKDVISKKKMVNNPRIKLKRDSSTMSENVQITQKSQYEKRTTLSRYQTFCCRIEGNKTSREEQQCFDSDFQKLLQQKLITKSVQGMDPEN